MKFSFHSGLSVFFLVWDLYTRCPLRWNTTKGSDLPVYHEHPQSIKHRFITLTTTICYMYAVAIEQVDSYKALVCGTGASLLNREN